MFKQDFKGNTFKITCRSINMIYYLKCNLTDKKETYIGETVRDFNVGLKSQMKQHILEFRECDSTFKFSGHVFICGS